MPTKNQREMKNISDQERGVLILEEGMKKLSERLEQWKSRISREKKMAVSDPKFRKHTECGNFAQHQSDQFYREFKKFYKLVCTNGEAVTAYEVLYKIHHALSTYFL